MSQHPLILLGKMAVRHRSGHRSKELPNSLFFPCLCGNMEEGMLFRSQESSTFVTFTTPTPDHLPRERGPENRRDSVKERKMRRRTVSMDAKSRKRFRVVRWVLFFSTLLALTGGTVRGEELYTRTDELSCGNTVMRAYTTCTEDSHDLDTAVCTDQHFLFINKKAGAVVKVDASGKPIADRGLAGGKIGIRYDALARDWACLESGAGSFVYLNYTQKAEPRDGDPTWEELLDLKGKRLATGRMTPFSRWHSTRKTWNRTSDEINAKFNKVFHSKGFRGHPAPIDEFEPLQIFKTDRTDKYFDP